MDSLLQWLKEDMSLIKEDIKDIREDVAKLLAVKHQIIGGTVVVSLLITTIFNIILALIGKHGG